MDRYPDLKYKFQDGCTHIWMNEDVVVKLSFSPILAQHEVDVLSMNLTGLPTMLDHWTNEDECFIVGYKLLEERR